MLYMTLEKREVLFKNYDFRSILIYAQILDNFNRQYDIQKIARLHRYGG